MQKEPVLADLLTTSQPAELGPGPRQGIRTQSALQGECDDLFHKIALDPEQQKLIRALILLWHDHLDAAHALAQSIETPNGALVHAIMHRREPDYGNAAYWFRRAGNHPSFPALTPVVCPILEPDKVLAQRLLPDGQWDPLAFVDACREAGASSSPQSELLRQIQKIEFEVLLEFFSRAGSRL